ncbi:MAG: aminotransferase class I/II-fold pyridoxal phosphate-dependent enzyme, partial [Planctomycetota bacterium]
MSPSITLRLDANEGVGQTDAVLEALRSVAAEDLRRYPDATALERRIADEHGVDASRIVLTNGGDDAIDRICRAVLQPGRTMLTHEPAFVMITRSARLAGAAVETI